MKLLVIDNRDSFTFNLVDAFAAAGADVEVVRNRIDSGDAIARAEGGAILLSPGPGTPQDAGCCLDVVRRAKSRVPVIGICLGHQAIVEAAGGVVQRGRAPSHAVATPLAHDGTGIMHGLPNPFTVGRYHSLVTPVTALPSDLSIDARHGDLAMAVRDDHGLRVGLQFHPESILTPRGDLVVGNLLSWVADRLDRRHAA